MAAAGQNSRGKSLFEIPEKLRIAAMRGDHAEPPGGWLDHADPGPRETADVDCDTARLREELLAAAHAHDQRVDATQNGVDARQPADFFLFFDMFQRERDIARHLAEERHFLFVEEAGFGGVEGKYADRAARNEQRK